MYEKILKFKQIFDEHSLLCKDYFLLTEINKLKTKGLFSIFSRWASLFSHGCNILQNIIIKISQQTRIYENNIENGRNALQYCV